MSTNNQLTNKGLTQRIIKHNIIKSELSMGVQLGLPLLSKKNDKLILSYKAHIERVSEKGMEYFPCSCNVSFIYPFDKLLSFERNLDADNSKACCFIEADNLKSSKYLLNEIYDECIRLITRYKEEGKISDMAIKNYTKKYYSVVKQLGLEAVYGEEE